MTAVSALPGGSAPATSYMSQGALDPVQAFTSDDILGTLTKEITLNQNT